jgi:hypothetical protein
MEILDMVITVLSIALSLAGAVGGSVFLFHACKLVKENAEKSADFNHEEDMGACVEYIMYMVTAIFFYLGAVVGLIILTGVTIL